MNLRDAVLGDLDAVWELESRTFGSEAWTRSMMLEELTADHRRYIVLEGENGEIAGYAGLLVVGTEGDIQTIAVAEPARGAGQGRRLINELLDEAGRRGVTEVFLEVRADNPTAQNLYDSLGFEGIGIRPRYYQPDDVDAVVMRLEMEKRR